MQDELKNLVRITPAVLPHSWAELEQGLLRLHGVAKAVQIDVVKDIFAGREALPDWEEFDFEFDIYIEPAPFVARVLELGASAVVVHARHTTAREALEALQATRTGDYPVYVGIGLRSSDTADVLNEFEGLYDYVQVMGIEHEGKQDEPFDPRAVELVRALKTAKPQLLIQIDGHAAGHEHEFVGVGAKCLVVGSAIIAAADPHAAYKDAQARANEAVQ